MKVNFNVQLTNIYGTPMAVDESGTPMTLGMVAVNALLGGPAPGEKQITGEQALLRYQIAQKIANPLYDKDKEDSQMHQTAEVSAEEIVLIKRRIEVFYSPVIVGRVHELLTV